MSWLDQVVAVPSIGCRFGPKLRSASRMIDELTPYFDELSEQDGAIQFDQEGPLTLKFQTERTGFSYVLEPSDIIVEYRYPTYEKRTPEALPQQKYRTSMRDFSDLLDELYERYVHLVEFVLRDEDRKLARTGFIANCLLDLDEPPPGVQDLIQHFGRPWPGGVHRMEARFLGVLEESEEHTSQCHHHIKFNRSAEEPILELALDWQRRYEKLPMVSSRQFEDRLYADLDAATNYYEKIAKGGLQYATD